MCFGAICFQVKSVLYQPSSAPQNAYRGPLMVICKKSYVMLHLETEWPSKENILFVETI